MNKIATLSLILIFSVIPGGKTSAQISQSDCNPNVFVVDTTGSEINWQQFPDFTLPFTVIYHGNAPSDSLLHPLKKGFSHLATSDLAYIDTLYPDQRAYTWAGIANEDGWALNTNQPWRLIKSPWGNNIPGYRIKWKETLDYIRNYRYKYIPPEGKNLDIVIADLEWAFHDDDDILSIKNDTLVPTYYQNLSNSAFITEYKIAMAELYGASLQLMDDILHHDVLKSSYNELPIRRTWWGIYDYDWNAWISDSSMVDYLMNGTSGFMNSDFYHKHDILGPSIYNFYNVNLRSEGLKYLAYNLFTIEVNQHWSPKGQLVFCWLNYHPNSSDAEAIEPWMAEATAIFPFMAGAMGLYPWLPRSYDTYEYFIYGLYRLSQYSDMFDGNQSYVVPEPAYYSFINESPIWRGVVNKKNILIAAQNPYASLNETTHIKVSYETWADTIALKGNETFLCQFEWDTNKIIRNDSIISEFKIYPNPSDIKITIEGPSSENTISIYDIAGKLVYLETIPYLPHTINIEEFSPSIYFLIIKNNTTGFTLSRKLIIY